VGRRESTRLIYDDDNKRIFDNYNRGQIKGVGAILAFTATVVSLVILFLLGIVAFDIFSNIQEGDARGVIIDLIFSIAILVILGALDLFIILGASHNLSIRDLKIYEDHVELSSFKRNIPIGDIEWVLDTSWEIERNRDIVWQAGKGIRHRFLKDPQPVFIHSVKEHIENGDIVIIYRKNRNKLNLEILEARFHNDIGSIKEIIELIMIDPKREYLNETLEDIRKSRSRTIEIIPVLDKEMIRSLKMKWAPISIGITLMFFTGGFASFFLEMVVLGPVLFLLGIFCFLFALFPVLLIQVKGGSGRYELIDDRIEIENFICRSRYAIAYENIEKTTKLKRKKYRKFFRYLGIANRKDLLNSCSLPYLNKFVLTLRAPLTSRYPEPGIPRQEFMEVLLADDENWTGYDLIKRKVKEARQRTGKTIKKDDMERIIRRYSR
jgi:hypothetical protein